MINGFLLAQKDPLIKWSGLSTLLSFLFLFLTFIGLLTPRGLIVNCVGILIYFCFPLLFCSPPSFEIKIPKPFSFVFISVIIVLFIPIYAFSLATLFHVHFQIEKSLVFTSMDLMEDTGGIEKRLFQTIVIGPIVLTILWIPFTWFISQNVIPNETHCWTQSFFRNVFIASIPGIILTLSGLDTHLFIPIFGFDSHLTYFMRTLLYAPSLLYICEWIRIYQERNTVFLLTTAFTIASQVHIASIVFFVFDYFPVGFYIISSFCGLALLTMYHKSLGFKSQEPQISIPIASPSNVYSGEYDSTFHRNKNESTDERFSNWDYAFDSDANLNKSTDTSTDKSPDKSIDDKSPYSVNYFTISPIHSTFLSFKSHYISFMESTKPTTFIIGLVLFLLFLFIISPFPTAPQFLVDPSNSFVRSKINLFRRPFTALGCTSDPVASPLITPDISYISFNPNRCHGFPRRLLIGQYKNNGHPAKRSNVDWVVEHDYDIGRPMIGSLYQAQISDKKLANFESSTNIVSYADYSISYCTHPFFGEHMTIIPIPRERLNPIESPFTPWENNFDNPTRKRQGPIQNKSPPNVYLVILDHLSTPESKIYLPEIMKTMKKMYNNPLSSHNVVDFPYFHSVSSNSIENQPSIFQGKPIDIILGVPKSKEFCTIDNSVPEFKSDWCKKCQTQSSRFETYLETMYENFKRPDSGNIKSLNYIPITKNISYFADIESVKTFFGERTFLLNKCIDTLTNLYSEPISRFSGLPCLSSNTHLFQIFRNAGYRSIYADPIEYGVFEGYVGSFSMQPNLDNPKTKMFYSDTEYPNLEKNSWEKRKSLGQRLDRGNRKAWGGLSWSDYWFANVFSHSWYTVYTSRNLKCIYGQFGDQLILDYVENVRKLGGSQPLFTIMGMYEFHSRRKDCVVGLDYVVSNWIQQVTTVDPNSIIVFFGDHGAHYGDAQIYHNDPYLSFIFPKSLVGNEQLVNDQVLSHNQRQFITSYDLYKTFSWIAQWGTNTEDTFSICSDKGRTENKFSTFQVESYNIFQEYVSPTRTCFNAWIFAPICRHWQSVSFQEANQPQFPFLP